MSERLQRLSALLDELFELDEPARRLRLAQIAGDDAALAAELCRVLEADEHSSVLDHGIARAAGTVMSQLNEAAATAPRAEAGKRIGHYRLLERLGSGGMGEVWRGERSDGEFEQQVAVKLIRPLLDSPHLRERFARERRILARLDHPHVARLLDGGVGDDGTPWYAMEFVRGRDIVAHAREHHLDARQRVERMLQVCDAVAHAQSHLVVHRDLKPSNILVDKEGRARVLDFGIARLLDESADVHLTGTGVRLFSPSYAAPEQIRGDVVGAAADVFSLGAVLYELLTGEVPHPRRSAVPERLLATLDQETAPRASQALRDTGAHGNTQRTTCNPRDVAGDLDTIVATALQPDAARRYAGAAQLADDLRRWLEGRPIAARADTAGYRMRKFVSRHRFAVGSASAVLLALIAGLGAALWQASVAREHAARADAEARRANAEAQRASAETARAEGEAAKVKAQAARVRKVKDFLVSIFLQADPMRRRAGGPVTIGEAFDTALQRAHAELADDPVLQADVFDDFGEIRANQLRFDEADALFKQALAVAEKEYGPDHPVVAESLMNLAAVESYRGRTLEGAAYLERAVGMLEKDDGGDPLALASALTSLGAIRQAQGRLPEAIDVLRRALSIDRKHLAPDDLQLSATLTNLAMLEANAERTGDALAQMQEAMRIVEKVQGPDSPRLLPLLSQLGHIHYRAGQHKEELQVLERSLAIARKNFKDDHQWKAMALLDLGWARAREDDPAGGVALLRDAVAMYERLKSPDIVMALRPLGVIQNRQGDKPAALATFNRGLDACRASHQETEQNCIVIRGHRAHALARAGRGAEALAESEAVSAALQKLSPDGLTSERAQALQARAAALAALQRRDDALAQQDQAIEMLTKTFGADHAETKAAIQAREAMK